MKICGFLTAHILVLAFGFFLVLVSVFPVEAQASLDNLDFRVRAVEAMNLEHRLSVMETLIQKQQQDAEERSTREKFFGGGIGLLVMERAVYTMRRKTKKEFSDLGGE